MRTFWALISTIWLGVSAAAGPVTVVPSPDAHRAIAAAIGAVDYVLEDLVIPPQLGGSFTVEVDLAGQVVHLDLSPSSIRVSGFTVQVSDGRGGLVAVAPPPVRTVRGVVRETGDPVAGALLASGLKAMVVSDTGAWSIGPVGEIWPAPRSLHFVVHSSDAFGLGGTCPGGVAPGGAFGGPIDRGWSPRGTVQVAELSAEADYELFVRNGASVDNTVADVEMVVQGMNVVYERDVGVSHLLGGVVVRTSEAEDPYLGITDSGDLLDAFRMWWNANQGGVHRDLTHLFTGKELDGSTIGLAYLGVVCSSPNYSYGLSETRFSSSLSSRVGLSAHEIGHNFSASHCSTPDCHIMCPSLGGCNGLGLPNFGPGAIGSITSHVASAGCLEGGQGQPLGLPFVDTFPLENFDARYWSVMDGVTITNNVVGEPSSPFVAIFDRGGSLTTDRIDMVGPFDRPLTVRFWAQSQNAAGGDNLQLSYMPEKGSPVVFATVTPPPSGFTTVGPVRLVLPAGAEGTNTHIGWGSTGSGGGSNWAIDDVRIEQAPALGASLFDSFDGSVIDQWTWPVAVGAVINAGSPDPTSPPFVLNLDNTDRVESRTIVPGTVPQNDDMWVSFDLQSNNVEANKSFRVRYWSGTQWVTVWEHAPRSTARSPFAPITIPLPEDAEHDALAIQLQALGAAGDDDWFVDELLVQRDRSFRLPIVDEFDDPAEMIDPTNWYPIEGAVINGGAAGEPSGTTSLNLDAQDRLTSRVVDLSGVGGENRLVLRMWLQSNGVDAGQRFYVDYRNAAGSWANAWSYTSASASRVTVGSLMIPLPIEALHAGAQIRLRVAGIDGTDDWFVDALSLQLETAPSLPVRDEFATTSLDPLVWADDDSVAINTGALDEPSPPYAMNLDRSEYAVMQPIVATSPGDGVVVRFWLQHNGVEPGKRLFVEYTDAGGVWRSGETFTSTSVDRVTYGFVNVALGADAAHAALQVRLRVDGADGSDDWFIDDLEVMAFAGLETPIFEPFLTTRLDRVLWMPAGIVPAVNQGAVGEPSDPYVLNLDKAEVLETGRLRGTGIAQRPMLRFWMQHNGVEPGETLTIEWLDNASAWNPIRTLVSQSASRSAGETLTIDLPQAAAHDQLRLRFSVSGEEPNDDWFLDDIRLESKTSLTVPFAEDFEEAAVLGLRNWSFFNGIVTQAGTNEPSGLYSMRLGSGGRGKLWPMDLEGRAGPLYARLWAQYSGGPSAGNSIAVQYADAGGVNRLLGLFRSDDAVAGAFTMFEVKLPPEALHDAFALELVATVSGGSAFFFVDDVQVDGERRSEECAADMSGDGVLDFFDVQMFLNAFAASDPAADFNGDGQFDFFDLLAFLGAFGAGCV